MNFLTSCSKCIRLTSISVRQVSLKGFRLVSPEENSPHNPNSNPNRKWGLGGGGAIFLGGNCPDTSLKTVLTFWNVVLVSAMLALNVF